ncbi:MAG: hypothetical protein M5U17_10975 [Ignavibacterium sp.]|nr:hypothetical protein [Ignavibacterium sp.]
MKKSTLFIVLVVSSITFGQFKDPVFPTETPKDGITDKSSNYILGFINPDNFSMKHSIGLSYSTIGGYGTSLATYTNSMFYKFADNMNLQLDASIITSPYSSLGKDFQNSIQGLYITSAAFNYKPWDDFSISVQYRAIPNYFYDSYYRYNRFSNNWFYNDFFDSGFGPFSY